MSWKAPDFPRLRAAIEKFDRSVVLKQPMFWSRAIMFTIMSMTVVTILWAVIAKVEQVVGATGKLEPSGAVREIQSPVAGVVTVAHVKDGQRVKQGDLLVSLDPKVTEAQIASLDSVSSSLEREIQFYQQVMNDGIRLAADGKTELKLPQEMIALAKDRSQLTGEIKLFQAQINLSPEGIDLLPNQKLLYDAADRDRRERLKGSQLKLQQAQEQLDGAKSQLAQSKKLMVNNKEVMDSYNGLVKEGAVSKVEYLAREADYIRSQNEVQKLETMTGNLQLEIDKAKEEITNINTRFQKDALAGQEKDKQFIGEIDARLSKAMLTSQSRFSEVQSQLTQLRKSLSYHDLTAPTDGVVFDLKAKQAGAVVAASDILLKIVPGEALVAKVYLTNKDIGFVREGMEAEVRVDSFPHREFGGIDGKLAFVGSDALPPTQATPYYTFPARIQMDKQWLMVRGQKVNMQSGMAVTVNIKVRKRSVMSIFLDFLLAPVQNLEEVR